MDDQSREIILYHYSYSPYARRYVPFSLSNISPNTHRVTWYLNLRQIPYTQCVQPPTMPRPDVSLLGASYRRIPLLTIGRDIYLDTRLILSKLESLFPPSAEHPALASPQHKSMEKLLEHWAIDNGLFNYAAALIPSDMPLLKDEKFQKDREDYTGRSWSRESMERGRPEALVEVRGAFEFLEESILGDGREWVLGGGVKGPSLADIEAVWPFHWLRGLKGALPAEYISATQFPKTFAWIERFDAVVMAAMKKNGKAPTISGPEAVNKIGSEGFAEREASVDESDPTKLKKGEMVEVWPIDSGFTRRDRGRLVGLSVGEVVIEGRMEGGGEVRIHSPRHGFRVRRLKGSENL